MSEVKRGALQSPADTARTTNTVVRHVQNIGANGSPVPSGASAGDPIHVSITDIPISSFSDTFYNLMVSKATFDILGLMTDPRFLNLQCEDPGAGTLYDVSGQGHDGTYQGSMTTGDRVKEGMGWAVDFDGNDDHVSFADNDDFSFGDGTNDEAVTLFGVIEVTDAGYRAFASKWDATIGSELREWQLYLDSSERMVYSIYDESANVSCDRTTDVALSLGWHSYVITYNGAGGGTAGDTITFYVDGSLVASTASNNGSYVAMENTTAIFIIGGNRGTSGTLDMVYGDDIALNGMDGSEWSAYDVHRFHQLCKGLYGL